MPVPLEPIRITGIYQSDVTCALRGVVNNRVWLTQSVIVVKDGPDETILALLSGAECAFPEGYWHRRIENDHSGGSRRQVARGEQVRLREFGWLTNRLLIFLEPEKYYALFLFWDGVTGQFLSYYVNFQLPYIRSHCGFDTLDLDLDIVISPEYHWHWKDEDEYQAGIAEGGILPEWVGGIERVNPEVLDRINRRAYPLDGSWQSWQPDPG